MTRLLPLLCYCAAAVCVAGMGWRLFTWLRAPLPLNIVLTPAPVTGSGVSQRIAGELFLFRSLLKGDRSLWWAAWSFHVSLVMLAVGHFGGLVAPAFTQRMLGLTEGQFHELAQVAGGAFGILTVVPLAWLLLRRVAMERVRYISTLSDYLSLGLLLLIIISGNQMRFMGGLDLAQARQFVWGLLTLHPVAAPADPAFALHLILISALLAYIPFSKLVHLGGLFFSPTLTQKNDPRRRRHIDGWDTLPA
jgi:respiratory nitrate reductase gamma subunit